MTTGGAIILGSVAFALLFNVFMIAFHGLGVLWAIPGAFICARIAKGKNLKVRSHAVRGGLYSALNFWLWFYYMRSMQGKEMSDRLICIFFISLFVIWLYASVYFSFMAAIITFAVWDVSIRYPSEEFHSMVAIWGFGITGTVSAVAWIVSLVRLWKAKNSYQALGHDKQVTPSKLPTVYLRPIVFEFIFSIIPIVIWVAVGVALQFP